MLAVSPTAINVISALLLPSPRNECVVTTPSNVNTKMINNARTSYACKSTGVL